MQAVGIRETFEWIQLDLEAVGIKSNANEEHLPRGRNCLARVVEFENVTKATHCEDRNLPVEPGAMLLNSSGVAYRAAVNPEKKIRNAASAKVIDEAHNERQD